MHYAHEVSDICGTKSCSLQGFMFFQYSETGKSKDYAETHYKCRQIMLAHLTAELYRRSRPPSHHLPGPRSTTPLQHFTSFHHFFPLWLHGSF
jgi:hypothetical protein